MTQKEAHAKECKNERGINKMDKQCFNATHTHTHILLPSQFLDDKLAAANKFIYCCIHAVEINVKQRKNKVDTKEIQTVCHTKIFISIYTFAILLRFITHSLSIAISIKS